HGVDGCGRQRGAAACPRNSEVLESAALNRTTAPVVWPSVKSTARLAQGNELHGAGVGTGDDRNGIIDEVGYINPIGNGVDYFRLWSIADSNGHSRIGGPVDHRHAGASFIGNIDFVG